MKPIEELLNERKNIVINNNKGFTHKKEMTATEHSNLAYYQGILEAIRYMGYYTTNDYNKETSHIHKL